MSKLNELCDKINQITSEICIFDGAMEFVNRHVDDSNECCNRNLGSVLWVLQKFSDKLSNDMSEIELLAYKLNEEN